jgi:cytochrome c oxidase assembly protein subunit 15
MSHNLAANENTGLHRFAVFTACCTVLLIFAGGLVAGTGSGLAVPNWPLSYGVVFPRPIGGIFYEHGHRFYADQRVLYRPALAMLVTVAVQLTLGALTVSAAKAVIPTTAHVATGALVLFTSLVLTLCAFGMVARLRHAPVHTIREPAWR